MDEKEYEKINKDLNRIKREIKKIEGDELLTDELLTDDGLGQKPFISQPIPPEMERKIKNLPADEHCDFIIHAKRTTFSQMEKEIKKTEDDELLTDDGLDEKPFIPQPIPPKMERKIKNLPADEHCDFIIHAKRTTCSQMYAFIYMCVSGAFFVILVFRAIMMLKNQDFNVLDISFLISLAAPAFFAIGFIFFIQLAFFDDAWFVGTPKRLLKYRKNKVEDSFDWNELTEDIKVRGALEEGSIKIVTKRTDMDSDGGIYVVNIYLRGIKNPHKIEKLIRKRVILNSIQWVH